MAGAAREVWSWPARSSTPRDTIRPGSSSSTLSTCRSIAKIETIARRIYGAAAITMENKLRKRLERFQKDGFGALPVCIAKTQYSLSDDDEALNSPRDFTLTVTDVSLRAGAGFVVALCGDIMTMPGLPRIPAAERIGVGEDGEIIGIIG